MHRLGFGSMVAAAAGFLMALGLAHASQAEDGFPDEILCGLGCGLGTLSAPDILLTALPGSTFVVTVAHLPRSPEEAFQNGQAVQCRPVEFRVDALRIGGKDGAIEVKLGERQKLAPGQSAQIVHSVDGQANTRAFDMDQMAFRLRAIQVAPGCDLVASGAFYEDASSAKSVPFSLLVSDGAKPNFEKR